MNARPLIAIGIDLDWPLPHHYDVIRGIFRECDALGWECRVLTCLETSKVIDSLPDGYDGIIARVSPTLRDYCEAHDIPLVNVWSGASARAVHTVSLDYREMGRRAAGFFLQRGFRNFGLLCRPDDFAAEQMRLGMKPALESFDCELSLLHVRVPYELNDWLEDRDATAQWLDCLPLPAAVISADPNVTRTFVDYCQWRGLMIPDDVAVISCRDSDLICGGISPELTAIAPEFEVLGRESVRLLEELMLNPSSEPVYRTIQTKLEVIERRSTDTQPVDDRVVARALRYIRDHSHRPMFVPEVAKAVGMSQRNLERRFRASMDLTISRAIVDHRLLRAKRLLLGSDMSIKEIADTVGFGSNVRMAQVFAKHVGQTPREYRQSN